MAQFTTNKVRLYIEDPKTDKETLDIIYKNHLNIVQRLDFIYHAILSYRLDCPIIFEDNGIDYKVKYIENCIILGMGVQKIKEILDVYNPKLGRTEKSIFKHLLVLYDMEIEGMYEGIQPFGLINPLELALVRDIKTSNVEKIKKKYFDADWNNKSKILFYCVAFGLYDAYVNLCSYVSKEHKDTIYKDIKLHKVALKYKLLHNGIEANF
ncbi:Hypothetical protein ORPV_1092 [Orpheovirus IHUMI-LCC2]|uniref:Uncharacterized protein n=1 Tax=Orpheovirus IHUMI-LCC2 TaxID=2023057 RepID=A0A2I2L658_9VIRU|nr:Hypothetical protein ORPV_1092 [Orpheovirus IHUMI-LCC2]SNW62996.1 Hypothetical protein ORPV_1092 [Orpheovirus IHUMI-LCC2]